jgi:hypothetical protein
VPRSQKSPQLYFQDFNISMSKTSTVMESVERFKLEGVEPMVGYNESALHY